MHTFKYKRAAQRMGELVLACHFVSGLLLVLNVKVVQIIEKLK